MIGKNEYYPIKVHTQRGLIDLRHIFPGDKVIEYKTGNLLEVKKVYNHIYGKIYDVYYNDKRHSIYLDKDFILNGNNLIRIFDINKNTIFSEIKQYPIKKFNNKIRSPLNPDAYITGAFLMYGDLYDKYINLPYDMDGINSVLEYKYDVDYSINPITSGKVYFRYKANYKDDMIDWNQFFGRYDIPKITDYIYTPIKDRIQFIRGVFDTGFNKNISPYSIAISNKSENKLIEFQKILLSVGILSKVTYDPNFDKKHHDNNFKLEVIGDYDGYPGLFYDIDNIDHNLNNDNKIILYDPKFRLMIDKLVPFKTSGIMSNIKLEKPNALYIDENFLPRVSL